MTGRFIVVEGIDGSGKSTQVEALVKRLREQGREVWETFEPTDRQYGRVIRSILADPDASPVHRGSLPWLFALDRYHHVNKIQGEISAGRWVVCDRYILSSLAYNNEFLGTFQVLGLNTSFLIPDLTVVLDCPVSEALRRIEGRGGSRDLFETRKQLVRVDQSYRAGCQIWQAQGAAVQVVSALGTKEDVHERVMAAVYEGLSIPAPDPSSALRDRLAADGAPVWRILRALRAANVPLTREGIHEWMHATKSPLAAMATVDEVWAVVKIDGARPHAALAAWESSDAE